MNKTQKFASNVALIFGLSVVVVVLNLLLYAFGHWLYMRTRSRKEKPTTYDGVHAGDGQNSGLGLARGYNLPVDQLIAL
jgi:hypothetical protein